MRVVNNELLAELTQRLVAAFQPEQVILFGSHAWGVTTESSDVDVMVIVAQSRQSDYERALQGHRSLSGLDIAKDVIVRSRDEFDLMSAVRGSLEHKINQQGRVLYDRRQGASREELARQSAR